MAQPARRLTTPAAALFRYRVMSWVVGTMLIFVFIFIGSNVDGVLGPIHGALYIIYLLAVLEVWIRFRLRLLDLAAMVACGWVPLMAFVVEHWMNKRLRPRLQEVSGAGHAPGGSG